MTTRALILRAGVPDLPHKIVWDSALAGGMIGVGVEYCCHHQGVIFLRWTGSDMCCEVIDGRCLDKSEDTRGGLRLR
jgi:hypothetical protein